MNYLKILAILTVLLFSSCTSLPDRVSSEDIPEWCQKAEKEGSFLSYVPVISTIISITDALSDDVFYACGIASGKSLAKAKDESLSNAQDQILSQLIGRVVSKINRDDLVDDYEERLHKQSFGYKVVEFAAINIKDGYAIFTLIETKGKDFLGTVEALKRKAVAKKAVEPVAEKALEPIAEKVLEPIAEKALEPIAEKALEPVAEKVVEPVVEKAVEKVAEPVVEKVIEKVVEKVAEPVVEKVIEKVVEKVTK